MEEEAQPGLAVFDFDGTLVDRDSFLAFLIYAIVRRPSRWIRVPWLLAAVCFFALGRRGNAWLKSTFIRSILGSATPAWGDRVADDFTRGFLDRRLRPRAREVIQQYRDEGWTLLLLSASPDFIVERFGTALGFEHIRATRTGRDEGGVPDGRLPEGNFRGEIKIRELDAFISENGPFRETVAFTDHHSDIPLLERVDRGCLVSPTPRLRLWSKGRSGIECVDWG